MSSIGNAIAPLHETRGGLCTTQILLICWPLACKRLSVLVSAVEMDVNIILIESCVRVQVAREHVPAERNDYVTIAYMPLKGEH